MSPPLLQVNNFIQGKTKNYINKYNNLHIDTISKTYIIPDFILGVNRISLFSSSKILFIFMICCYMFMNALHFYGCYCNIIISSNYLTIFDTSSFFLFTTLGGLFHTRLCKFYNELNKFDDDIGFKAQAYRGAQYNMCVCLVSVGLSLILFYTVHLSGNKTVLFFICIPISLILHALEFHYYGHLFSLVIPRLKLLINYFNLSYPNPHRERDNIYSSQEFKNFTKQHNKYSHMDLEKLTTFYDRIIIIYDDLNNAIKWQMASLLCATFIYMLGMCYVIALIFISEKDNTLGFLCINFTSPAIKLAHFLAPCLFADRVHSEACVLRELLACRLFENTLDKSSRSSARTLLALIETSDLSFSLFHMVNVDISLPFKLMGLLLTYTVILLQFNKLINS